MTSTTRILLLLFLLAILFSFLVALTLGSFSYFTLSKLYVGSSSSPGSSGPVALPAAYWMPITYPWGGLFSCDFTGDYPSLVTVNPNVSFTSEDGYQVPTVALRVPSCGLYEVGGGHARLLSDPQDIGPDSFAFKSTIAYKFSHGTGVETVVECENGQFPSAGVRMECDVKAGRYMYFWCGGWAVAIGFILVALA